MNGNSWEFVGIEGDSLPYSGSGATCSAPPDQDSGFCPLISQKAFLPQPGPGATPSAYQGGQLIQPFGVSIVCPATQ